MPKKRPATSRDDSRLLLANASEALRLYESLAKVIETKKPVTLERVNELECVIELWFAIEKRMQDQLQKEARVTGELALEILSRKAPALFYAFAMRLQVNAHCAGSDSSNWGSPAWHQTWDALRGAAMASSPKVRAKPKGHPRDPDADAIEAAYLGGERNYHAIAEKLGLQKWKDRFPYTRVKLVVEAMKKRERKKKASDSK